MQAFEIPLLPQPQTFRVELLSATYALTVKWNTTSLCWVLDIADALGVMIVAGLPLLPGADMLGQHAHLGLGGGLKVKSQGDWRDVPDFKSLGDDGQLFFVTQ